MSDDHRISAYWGASYEAASEVAKRLTECLQRLTRVHPALYAWRGHWKNEDERLAGPKEPWVLDLPRMTELVESGRFYNESDNRPEEDLGFIVGGRAGGCADNDDAGVSFSMSAAAHAKFMAPNSFTLKLPPPQDAPNGLFDPAIVRSTLEAIVETWRPQWGNLYLQSAARGPAAFRCPLPVRSGLRAQTPSAQGQTRQDAHRGMANLSE